VLYLVLYCQYLSKMWFYVKKLLYDRVTNINLNQDKMDLKERIFIHFLKYEICYISFFLFFLEHVRIFLPCIARNKQFGFITFISV